MKKTKRKVPRLSRSATDEEIVRWTKAHDVFDRLEAGVSEKSSRITATWINSPAMRFSRASRVRPSRLLRTLPILIALNWLATTIFNRLGGRVMLAKMLAASNPYERRQRSRCRH